MSKYEWICEAAVDFRLDRASKWVDVPCRKPARLFSGLGTTMALCDQHEYLAHVKESTCES